MVLNTRYLGDKTKGIFRVVYALPWMFTASVIAILWRMMLDPKGVINFFITTFNLTSKNIVFLASRDIALKAVTLINIWSGYPFYMISILAGLQGISTDLYEASALDGANAIQTYFRITLPQLKPVIISLLMLDFVWTLQQFALIWMTTGGGPVSATETISTYIYKQGFTKYEYSLASTGAVILLLVKAKVAVPLVLHGGSNNSDEEIGKSVTLGINKINISSDIKVAYHKIELFRTEGKAVLY